MQSLPDRVFQTPDITLLSPQVLGTQTAGVKVHTNPVAIFFKSLFGLAEKSEELTKKYGTPVYVNLASLAKFQERYEAESLDTDAQRMKFVDLMVKHIYAPKAGFVTKEQIQGFACEAKGLPKAPTPPPGTHAGGVFPPPMPGSLTAAIRHPSPGRVPLLKTPDDFLSWITSNSYFNPDQKTGLDSMFRSCFRKDMTLDETKAEFLTKFTQCQPQDFPGTSVDYMKAIVKNISSYVSTDSVFPTPHTPPPARAAPLASARPPTPPHASRVAPDPSVRFAAPSHAPLVPPRPMASASTGSGSVSSPTSFQVMLERAKAQGVCLVGGRSFPLTASLHNEHIAPISYGTKPDGTKQTYRCAEAAYQAQKFPVGQRAAFENLSGQQAIKLARQKIAEMDPKPDEEVWDNQKDEIMHDVLQEKFKQNPELKTLLLSTGEIPLGLVGEGYWSYHTGGKNNFGELLMRVRTELREPPAAGSPSAPSGSPPPVHAAPMASALPPTPPPTGRVALSPAAPISAGVPAARLPGASVPTRKLLEMPAEVGCPEFTPLTRDELNSFLGGAVFREFVELRSLHGDATMTEGIESAYSNGLQGRIPDSRACQIFSQQMKYVMYTIARAKPEDQRKLLRELTDGMQDCAPVAQRTVDRMYQRFIGSSGFESQFTAFIKGEKEKAVDRVIKRMYPRFSSEGYDPARDRPWNQEPHLKNGYIRFLGGEIGLKIGGSDTDPNANNVDPGERGAEFLRLFHEEFSVGNLVHSFVEQVNGSSEGAWRREINNTTFYSWCGANELGEEAVYHEEEPEKYPDYTHPGDEHKAETAAYITEQTALSVFTKLGYVS